MQTKQCIISGRVQGVGFRYFVLQHARKLGVRGYVRNLATGQVEVIAQGNAEIMEILFSHCRQGPLGAQVRSVEITTISDKQYYENFILSY